MHNIANKEVFSAQSFRDQLIIDVKYVNKQTKNMYLNKQTTAKAGFNLHSIRNFSKVKTTFRNIFLNIIHIDFTIFCLQTSKQITIMVGFNINFI